MKRWFADVVVEVADVDSGSRRPLDMVDVVALGLVGAISLLATWSLALAHLGHHSWWLVVLLSLVVGLPILIARHLSIRAALGRRHRGWWLVLPVLVVASILFFPGFPYATSDKDPGIYVLHGLEIADTGQLRFEATPLQSSGALTVDDVPGVQWRAFEPVVDGEILPWFFHLWPSLLGTAFDAFGLDALSWVTPLLAVVSVLAIFVLGRRLGGLVPAIGAASVLAVNMMNVWQARYPTAEILGQVLFVGSLVALVLALQRSRRDLAIAAGMLVTIGLLNRGEAVLMVLGVAAACAAAEVTSLVRVSRPLAVGLAIPLPFAIAQAYGPAERYSLVNGLPTLEVVLGALAVVLSVGVVLRIVASRRLDPVIRLPAGAWRILRRTAALLLVVGFILAVIRRLFGPATFDRNGQIIRSFDEVAIWRLALFFGWIALLLALVGALWVFAARPRTDRILAVGAGLVFLVLVLARARNSPQMMWWGRRFVPVAVPCLALLIGLSFGAFRRAVRSVPVALACFAVLMTVSLGQQGMYSVPLVGHSERANSYNLMERVAGAAGGVHSLFLWERGISGAGASYLLGAAVWARTDNDSALLPEGNDERIEYIRGLREVVGEMPILLVLERGSTPPAAAGVSYTTVARVEGGIPVFEESEINRPSRSAVIPVDVTIVRVEIDG